MPRYRLNVSLAALATVLALASVLLTGVSAYAKDPVTVGGYAFPPYVELLPDGAPTGVTVDMIEALNRSQDRYAFRFVLTTPTRRYQDLQAGRFDVMLFEMPEWGWAAHDVKVDVSRPIASDGEVYVARAEAGRDQTYFDDLPGKRIAAILGYNYGFAGFRSDPAELRKRFDIVLVNDHAATVELVLRGRADVGVVTQSYLVQHLREHPDERSRLLVSERRDQTYVHRVLTRPGAVPSAEAIADMIAAAEKTGSLATFWRQHGAAP